MPIIKVFPRDEDPRPYFFVKLEASHLAMALNGVQTVVNDRGYARLESQGYRESSMDFIIMTQNDIKNTREELVSEINRIDKLLFQLIKLENE